MTDLSYFESKFEKLKLNKNSSCKKCIAILSGKGGVGKSFVTALIASNLNKKGYKVGVLDGDIVGPSQTTMFNVHGPVYGDEDGNLIPIVTDSNIKVISSNMLIENEEDPLIWRASLVNSLLRQFYNQTNWGDLDYLLIDMPPGTSDVTLTAFQFFPLDGIIIVTSPQDLVSLIVKKAINMAKKMNIKILGIIENMSYVKCDKCGEKIYLYGKSKLESFAKEKDIKILGRFPISEKNSLLADKGLIENVEIDEINSVISEIENLEEIKND